MATIQRTIAPNSATVTGNISTSGNVDEYAMTLTAGLAYEFDIQGQSTVGGTLGSPSLLLHLPGVVTGGASSTPVMLGTGRLTFTPTTTTVYDLDVSGSGTGTYTLASAALDDYSNLASTTASLLPGASVSGSLQTYADTDSFGVNLVAGYSYQWDLYGQGTSSGTIASPALSLTQPNDSVPVNGKTITGGDVRVTYTPTVTAAYYLNVTGTSPGTYTLVATPQDDISNIFQTAPVITVGSRSGAFENVADADAFAINLVAGVTYQFDLDGANTGGGTATSPGIALYSVNDSSVPVASGVTASSGDSRIVYTATTTAAYYLNATGGQGTYTLVTASSAATGTPGNTTVAAGGSASITTGTSNVVNVPSGGSVTTASGTANRIVLGSGSPNTVQSSGTDTIIGGTGAATVTTKGTSATVVGGGGAMTLTNGSGTITAFAGTGGLTYTGGTGSETIVGTSGPIYVTGGTGGGVYFGGGNSKIVAGNGDQAIMVGYAGDQLFSAGSKGDLFAANAGGDIVMSGISSSGDDVFFGAAGTGKLTFIAGSGNDLMGVGQGTNLITLGSGRSTVFANTGTTGVTTITAGSGSADIGMGGKSVSLIIAAGASARTFDLFNFVPGADKIILSGFSSTAAATAVAGQTYANGITTLTLSDKTAIQLIGVTRADASYFG